MTANCKKPDPSIYTEWAAVENRMALNESKLIVYVWRTVFEEAARVQHS